jgi:hypothetical protein
MTEGATLHRIVEQEGPILSPFEIFGDCTQAHLDRNRSWLVPRFQDPVSGGLIITIQSFVIRRNGLTVLVDACGGNDKERKRPHFHRRSWPYLEKLRSAGVARKRRRGPVHASACRSCGLEHAARERLLGANFS